MVKWSYSFSIAFMALHGLGTRRPTTEALENYKLPDYFKLGTATAAFQVEGGWDADGKGPSIWDTLYQTLGNHQNEIACDSYHKYLEDVEMLRYLGADHYRFSISWPRILPTGRIDNINEPGIDYYRRLIKALKENQIEPMVTLYHWDLPQALQEDIGGWLSTDIVDLFGDYARLVFQTFGDDVKYWFTINEPKNICEHGYGIGLMAPNVRSSGVGDYQCAHNLLLAHAKAYHIYEEEFRQTQNGKVSIVLNLDWPEPGSDDPLDVEAAERDLQFHLGIYAHPIYSAEGNYPQIMIDRVQGRSLKQGYNTSRLPEFTQDEVDFIKGTSDFFSINYYSATNITSAEEKPIETVSFAADLAVDAHRFPDVNITGIAWPIVPWGLRKLLNFIHSQYGQPEIVITENGYGDLLFGGVEDPKRVHYYEDVNINFSSVHSVIGKAMATSEINQQHMFKEHFTTILEAIYEDGVNVTGYTAWSLMDNLEWLAGSLIQFGIYRVDFLTVNRTRTIKNSGEYLRQIITTRSLE